MDALGLPLSFGKPSNKPPAPAPAPAAPPPVAAAAAAAASDAPTHVRSDGRARGPRGAVGSGRRGRRGRGAGGAGGNVRAGGGDDDEATTEQVIASAYAARGQRGGGQQQVQADETARPSSDDPHYNTGDKRPHPLSTPPQAPEQPLPPTHSSTTGATAPGAATRGNDGGRHDPNSTSSWNTPPLHGGIAGGSGQQGQRWPGSSSGHSHPSGPRRGGRRGGGGGGGGHGHGGGGAGGGRQQHGGGDGDERGFFQESFCEDPWRDLA